MAEMVLGIFSERESASNAIDELERNGYNPKDISIVAKGEEDRVVTSYADSGSPVSQGAASGAVTGGVLGGLAGLLVGIGAVTLPGIGALLIGGPLAVALGLTGAAATTVSGAVTGALAGGLVGGLIGLGVPEEDAQVYEDTVRRGGVLLAVPVDKSRTQTVQDIMTNYHADKIRVIEVSTE